METSTSEKDKINLEESNVIDGSSFEPITVPTDEGVSELPLVLSPVRLM